MLEGTEGRRRGAPPRQSLAHWHLCVAIKPPAPFLPSPPSALTMWKVPRLPPPLSSSAVRPKVWRTSRKKGSLSTCPSSDACVSRICEQIPQSSRERGRHVGCESGGRWKVWEMQKYPPHTHTRDTHLQ